MHCFPKQTLFVFAAAAVLVPSTGLTGFQANAHNIVSQDDPTTRVRVARLRDLAAVAAGAPASAIFAPSIVDLGGGQFRFTFTVGPVPGFENFFSDNPNTRVTGLGFNFSGDFPNFTLTSSTGANSFTLVNDVASGLPGIDFDFALLTSNSFLVGNPGLGLAPQNIATFSVTGMFPQPAGGLSGTTANNLVDRVLVRLETIGPNGTVRTLGVASPLALTAVPEPATWAMFLLGFGAVGYSMRSRKVGYRRVGSKHRQTIRSPSL